MPKINTQKILGIQTFNCPVCNRQPTVVVDVEAFEHGVYECVTVKCHRLFRRKHIKVHGRGRTLTDAVVNGIQSWNHEVQKYKYTWAERNLHHYA